MSRNNCKDPIRRAEDWKDGRREGWCERVYGVRSMATAWKKGHGIRSMATAWKKGYGIRSVSTAWKKGYGIRSVSTAWKKGYGIRSMPTTWKIQGFPRAEGRFDAMQYPRATVSGQLSGTGARGGSEEQPAVRGNETRLRAGG